MVITYLKTCLLNVYTHRIFEKDIGYSDEIETPPLAHIIRMVDPKTTFIETLRQNIGCSLEKKNTKLI